MTGLPNLATIHTNITGKMLLKLLFSIFIILQLLTRTVLYSYAVYLEQIEPSLLGYTSTIALGIIPDIAVFIFFAALLSLFRLLITKKSSNNILVQSLGYILYFAYIAGLTFNIAAEYLFWDEFSTRFNFIAVDYLVYTREVVGNIMESYPVYKILIIIFCCSLVIFVATAKLAIKAMRYQTDTKKRSSYAIMYTALAVAIFFFGSKLNYEVEDRYKNEIIKNGIGSLFIAFRDNSLNYAHFYQNKDPKEVFTNLRNLIKAKNQEYINNDIFDLSRKVTPQGKSHRYNVILLSVESLSADYLGRFGNNKNLTPNIDKIIPNSLVFDRYFAVGTRTVRGLEAMTLSIPPVPGNAIVRRPNNENLSTIGSILRSNQYDTKFIYGGYGYFDNMNYYFANNDFSVIDRQNIAKEDIIFENIWGVADEVLFNQTLKEADASHAEGKPFFSLVMTTSNHRPYTYPDNRVAIASGTDRDGGVQYTDFAIGEFLEKAKKKEWFKNTIFIITADHCAASAGKQDLPVAKYHIPLIIYAPHIIKPAVNDKYTSQIDLAPTILGLLNVPYISKFYGNDALLEAKERVFISTYQKLGYMQDNILTILGPKQQADTYNIDKNYQAHPETINEKLKDEAIYYYQGASYSFDYGLLKK